MNVDTEIRPGGLIVKTIVVHTVTYFLMGILAFTLLDYTARFSGPILGLYMRPTDSPLIAAGPLFQPIRGLIFALVFYPLRRPFFGARHGWLLMWWTLVALGILGTFGPAPGSVEGMLFTNLPISEQVVGWLEVVPQAFLLSGILYYWVNHPEKKWLAWVLGICFVLGIFFSIMGLLMA